MAGKDRFTVLVGGRDIKPTVINTLSLEVVPDSRSPLPVEVRLFEEDTFLVLTVDPVMRYTEEHPIRLMTRVVEEKANKPGSIVTNEKSWYAIVHDLDNDPTYRPEWIEKAYQQALMLCEIKQVRSLGLPLLGTVHGKIPPEKSLEYLIDTIKTITFEHLKKILLLAPQRECEQIRQYLLKLLT